MRVRAVALLGWRSEGRGRSSVAHVAASTCENGREFCTIATRLVCVLRNANMPKDKKAVAEAPPKALAKPVVTVRALLRFHFAANSPRPQRVDADAVPASPVQYRPAVLSDVREIQNILADTPAVLDDEVRAQKQQA